MTDPLIDDVQALLDKEKGDERILKQIFRACENNEVISNYERNYVRNLVEKYLGRASPVEEKQQEKPVIPDVVFSNTPAKQKITTTQTTYPQIVKLKSNNTKMGLGIGGALLAIIVIIGISLSGISPIEFDSSQITGDSSSTLSIQTDLSTYQKGDIISISGTSTTSGKLNLSIENQEGQLIWSEQISVKSDGRFSTLAIAGGSGWDQSGTFTIKVENHLETKSKTFSFRA
ncbi:MAG: hypothetical protein HOO66_05400 [Nitrosarchaeum sp.]|nr:hypothetical protein [Nitrosarchaeum sp.]